MDSPIIPNTVQTISINGRLIPYFVDKAPAMPTPRQDAAVEHILRFRDSCGTCSSKVLIEGPRGSGKSFVARLLKQKLDSISTF